MSINFLPQKIYFYINKNLVQSINNLPLKQDTTDIFQKEIKSIIPTENISNFESIKAELNNKTNTLYKIFTALISKNLSVKNLPREIELDGRIFKKSKNTPEYTSDDIEIKIQKTEDSTLFTLKTPNAQLTQDTKKFFRISSQKDGVFSLAKYIYGKEGIDKTQIFLKDDKLIESEETGAKNYIFNLIQKTCRMFNSQIYKIHFLPAKDIYFSQINVNRSGYKNLLHSVECTGLISEPIQTILTPDNKLISLDNRRLKATKTINGTIPAIIHEMDEPLPEEYIKRFSKQSTGKPIKTWGDVLLNRLKANNLLDENNQIIYKSTPPDFI